ETSNRGTTNDRKKITQKVRESRKKKTKAAKKSVEWKSKHKKDPGIPNTFPYKDQILAEVAEQRRLVHKKILKKKSVPANENGTDAITEAEEDAQNGFDGIASISAKRLTAKAVGKPVPEAVMDTDDEDEDAPILINRDLEHLQAVLDEADAVIEVLDARDPLSFRSSHLEEIVASKSGRKTLLVVNKIDCAPQEAVKAWVSVLRQQQHPTLPFRSASSSLPGNPLIPANDKGKEKTKTAVDDSLGADAILECLSKWAEEKTDDTPYTVVVIGIANSGKSSLINSLVKKQSLPVYSLVSSSRGPTTTTMPQEIAVQVSGSGKTLRFIDTPGFAWDTDKTAADADQIRARDILLRNKGRIDRLKDPLGPVANLVSRANSEDLMLLYSLPAFPKGDIDAFISGVARSQQLVRKRGTLDLTGAAKNILRDWCINKIRWYTTPPFGVSSDTSATVNHDADLESLYAKSEAIFAHVESRKNMRKAGGLVKITPGQVDSRKVLTEVSYAGLVDSDDEDEEVDEMGLDEEALGEENEEGDDDDDDDDDEGAEEDEAEAELPVSRSQKRKRTNETALPSSKKVSFLTTSSSSKGKVPSKGSSKPKSSEVVFNKKIAPSLKRTKPVANAPSSKGASKSRPQKAGKDGEVYDFGKYF
ncbi:P-loop containing nucleoside triphosphate hydrolase protein, partial [Rhodocollybia butyracea]